MTNINISPMVKPFVKIIVNYSFGFVFLFEINFMIVIRWDINQYNIIQSVWNVPVRVYFWSRQIHLLRQPQFTAI